MQRLAFKMILNQGKKAEYRKRHDEIWPELIKLLHDTGVQDYSIFLDEESHLLFATLLIEEPLKLKELPSHPVMQKWWSHMKDIMHTHEDNSPVSIPLESVFYMP
ncbi:MAG TPA: L-rhamnose mutarotase [Saprospiraceae bacterium]|nr:L-rhamnose mutarotase [Saprospiraceae bacterium]